MDFTVLGLHLITWGTSTLSTIYTPCTLSWFMWITIISWLLYTYFILRYQHEVCSQFYFNSFFLLIIVYALLTISTQLKLICFRKLRRSELNFFVPIFLQMGHFESENWKYRGWEIEKWLRPVEIEITRYIYWNPSPKHLWNSPGTF